MEQDNVRWFIQMTVSLLGGGAAGALINNFYINRRKERKELVYEKEEFNVISKPNEDIKVIYDEKEITNLKVFNFIVKNNGNTGLTDLKFSIKIHDGTILSYNIDERNKTIVNSDHVSCSNEAIDVNINILNVGEQISFSFKVCNTTKDPDVSCRQKDLVLLEADYKIQNHIKSNKFDKSESFMILVFLLVLTIYDDKNHIMLLGFILGTTLRNILGNFVRR